VPRLGTTGNRLRLAGSPASRAGWRKPLSTYRASKALSVVPSNAAFKKEAKQFLRLQAAKARPSNSPV